MKKAFLQLHIAVFLAGFTGPLGRLITLNEGLLVWYRMMITALTMLLLFSLTKKLRHISTKDKIGISLTGFIAGLHWLFFYGSIKYANVSIGLICFSAVGFFTAILEPVIVKRKFSVIELLLGLIVIAGIFIIFHFDPRYKLGIALGIACALLGAIFPILNKQYMQRMNAETLLTWELTGGVVLVTFILPFYFAKFPAEKLVPGWSDWGWLLALSWFCSVWAFQLSANALKKKSAFTVNLSFNLEPVYGIMMAFLLFNENKYLSNYFYWGLLLIMLSVGLQTWRVYKQRTL